MVHSPNKEEKSALRGEPSHVWRAGQERRLRMIQETAGERRYGRVLVNGCGLGAYLIRLAEDAQEAVGLDIEFDRALAARQKTPLVMCAAGEHLPFPTDCFDLVLSHEVLEHVQDDSLVITEIIRVLRPGGRLVLFCPNRGYPFETHGIYVRGHYRFGNIPLVNYLPRPWRNHLAPHVRIYSRADLLRLFSGLPVLFIQKSFLFGAYDNIIARWPAVGKSLRFILQRLEKSPLKILGLSHFWVIEKRS